MNFNKQVLVVGDPVKFAGEKGSIGIVIAVKKGHSNRELFDVEWHFGIDSKGNLQKSRSYRLVDAELTKISNTLYKEYVTLKLASPRQKEVYERIVFENYFR